MMIVRISSVKLIRSMDLIQSVVRSVYFVVVVMIVYMSICRKCAAKRKRQNIRGDPMIFLYSGTPGSGKSLHVAERLYHLLRAGRPTVCNFPINLNRIPKKKRELFCYKSNLEITPDFLIEFSREHFKGKKVKESSLLLVIDECQLMFNARDWSKSGRDKWLSFFTLHRHYGYDIILIAQFDRMIDRQIRSLIEYEYIHRKVSNFGLRGMLLCAVMLSPKLFVSVKVWYPMKEKVSSEFFKCKRKYYSLYDTYLMLDAPE